MEVLAFHRAGVRQDTAPRPRSDGGTAGLAQQRESEG